MQSKHTARDVKKIDQSVRPFAEYSLQLPFEWVSLNKAYETMVIVGDTNYMAEAQAHQQTISNLLSQLTFFKEIPYQQFHLAQQIRTDFQDYISSSADTYLTLAEQGNEPSDELLQQVARLHQQQSELTQRITTQREHAKTYLRKEITHLRSSTATKSRLSTIVFIFVMLISIPLIGLVIHKYTLHPLNSLIHLIRGTHTIDPKSLPNDEIGELAHTFMEFTRNQKNYTEQLEDEILARKSAEQELVLHQENLESIIESRTENIKKANRELENRTEELRDSEARIRAIFSSMREGVCLHDLMLNKEGAPEDYRIALINPAFEEITGIPNSQAIGSRGSLLYGLDEAPFLETYAQVVNTGTPATFETYFEPTGKHLLISATKAGDQRFVTIVADISPQKQVEAELQQAQKLESVGQLAAGIAHEINTPIQFVGDNIRFIQDAFADLQSLQEHQTKLLASAKEQTITPELITQVEEAMEEADLDYLTDEIPQAITQSMEGVHRVSTIVRAMKEFAHPGGQEMLPTNLNETIETTITVARNEWKYVADLETEFDLSLPEVPCLRDEFNQVILNLIVNARDAIAEQEKQEKGTITISTTATHHAVQVRVSDNAGGIPAHIQDRIFDPFFTTKEVGRGSGQGLAIAHGVITKKHKGTLSFTTKEGEGTTFIITLPLEPPSSPEAAT